MEDTTAETATGACPHAALKNAALVPIYAAYLPETFRHLTAATGYRPRADQGSIAMMTKRVGNWAWALSVEERVAAASVGRSQREKNPISAKLKRKYDAMIEKQRKLTAH